MLLALLALGSQPGLTAQNASVPSPLAANHAGEENDTAAPADAPAKPDPAAERYWQAIKLLNSNKPADREAGKTALQAASDLEFIHAQIQLAQCYLAGGYGFKKNERRAVELLRLAAERGNGYALVSLAGCCVTGTGMHRDETLAAELLQRALKPETDFSRPIPPPDFEFGADADDGGVVGQQNGDPANAARASAHYLLGVLLTKAKKIAEAQIHFVAAAEAGQDGRDGLFQAAVAAALNYAFGQGVPRDLAKANALLERSRHLSARQGVNLIHNYSALKLVDEFAVADLEQAAEKSGMELEAGLQLQIASQFADKKSKEYNLREAARWYELAAESDQAWAMIQLGLLYSGNELGAPDPAKAFYWFERAGRGPSPKHYLGAANLAICYQNGLGTPKDPEKANEIFRRHRDLEFVCYLGSIGQCPATPLSFDEVNTLLITWAKKKGDTHAQYLYGQRLLYGWGVKADRSAAEKWLKKAAKAKHGGALCLLGLLAENANTVVIGNLSFPSLDDQRRAADYYRQGSEAGDPDATANYATMLMNGAGVKADLDLAEATYRKCLALSPEHARAYCNLGALYEHKLRQTLAANRASLAVSGLREQMLQCYEKSAALNFGHAAANLATLYREGRRRCSFTRSGRLRIGDGMELGPRAGNAQGLPERDIQRGAVAAHLRLDLGQCVQKCGEAAADFFIAPFGAV